MTPLGWFAIGAVGGGVLYFASRAAANVQELPAGTFSLDDITGSGEKDFAESIIFSAEATIMADWYEELMTGRGAPYRWLFEQAENTYSIPRFLLARQAWQESHYNPRAHNAKSDASGIMQIVPRWHPGVDPYDPPSAIPYAASYLAKLKRQFGSWQLALMAYNWGPGNVSKWIKGGKAGFVPSETINYNRDIIADVAAINPGANLA